MQDSSSNGSPHACGQCTEKHVSAMIAHNQTRDHVLSAGCAQAMCVAACHENTIKKVLTSTLHTLLLHHSTVY